MFYLTQFLIAAFAVLGFALLFNCPIKIVPVASLFSGIAWLVYKIIIMKYGNFFMAGFMSAFVLGIIGECAAIIFKKPATLFILPGLLPMVPGAGMYYTMYYLIYNDNTKFQESALETFYIASSLAIGIVAATAFIKIFKTTIKKKLKHKHFI